MAARFARPRLIDGDDPYYRAFLAQIMLTKENQRASRPPLARDLFGGEVEQALRGWLAERCQLSERRILEYVEHRGRSAIKKYRELDAIVLLDQKRVHVFEIKASRSAGSIRRAAQQLRETQAILRLMFPAVYTTIMLVDTGIPTDDDIAALMAAPDAPPEPPPTLDAMLERLPHVRLAADLAACAADTEIVSLLRFSVADIVALAGAESLHLDWDEEEEEALDPADEPAPPRFAYSTDAEEPEAEDDNPLAAALRRAMRSEDGERR
jgi:hypothetical protein